MLSERTELLRGRRFWFLANQIFRERIFKQVWKQAIIVKDRREEGWGIKLKVRIGRGNNGKEKGLSLWGIVELPKRKRKLKGITMFGGKASQRQTKNFISTKIKFIKKKTHWRIE